MKRVLCGKGAVAVAALELMCEHGDEVRVVATRADEGVDGWQPSLLAAAQRLGVRVDRPPRINDPAFVRELAGFEPRSLISIQYDQILRPPLFEALPCPCLNLHFALLPRHRGVSPIAWSILEGDTVGGVTLHHMTPDVDAGDVIAQRSVPIAADTTARELYDALTEAARTLFADCHPFPRELLGRRLPQVAANACHHRAGDFDFSAREVDWGRPAPELHRWIRAMIFPPLQCPELRCGRARVEVRRIAAEIGDARGAAPGAVLRDGGSELEVAAMGGSIRIVELERRA